MLVELAFWLWRVGTLDETGKEDDKSVAGAIVVMFSR